MVAAGGAVVVVVGTVVSLGEAPGCPILLELEVNDVPPTVDEPLPASAGFVVLLGTVLVVVVLGPGARAAW